MQIREFIESDSEQLLLCIIELQEHERALEPLHRHGSEMAEEYFAFMRQQCLQKKGKIFVAVIDEALVGFSCVWFEEQFEEILAYPTRSAYISDLIVTQKSRGKGVGSSLMARAEAYAIEHDTPLLKIGVLSRNQSAVELYRKLGYRDYAITLVKKIGP